jgi:hypothetical protein
MTPRPAEIVRETDFGPVVQIAYHAPDIADAAHWCAKTLNAGPFYLFEHIKLRESHYRGEPAPFDHSSAYGQLSDMMIELIHQHGDNPSAVRDMYDAKTEGLHHLAVFVDDINSALARAASLGMACALDAVTSDGVRFAMADARQRHGCMLEFYEPKAALTGFYAYIKRKSIGWNGEDILRRL